MMQKHKIYVASSNAIAEWDLPTKDVDALSLMPEMLKVQIAQKDLQGKKLKATLDEDEQDKINAIQRRIRRQGISYLANASGTTEAQIVFVAALTDAVETEALSAAYESAAANAKVLAAASKVKLGKLRSIARSDTVDEMASTVQYEYDAYGNQVQKRPIKRGAKEVVSPTATGLSKTVNVHLSYEIE